jgi:chromosome partitioning protein
MIISFLSQKGGVGKSTLTRLIAREFAFHDWSVKIADMDTSQGTCISWHRRRIDAGILPEISAEVFSSVAKALKFVEQYDLILFDSAPHSTQMTLQIAKSSDVTILPCGIALDDLEPQVLLAHDLVKKGISKSKVAFAFCRVGDSEAELSEATDYIKHAGYNLLKGYIPERTGYRRASDAGQAITETPYKSLNNRAEELAQSIINLAQTTQKKGAA